MYIYDLTFDLKLPWKDTPRIKEVFFISLEKIISCAVLLKIVDR